MSGNKKYVIVVLIIALVTVIQLDAVKAQMFSVGEEARALTPPSSSLMIGFEPLDFSYQGDISQLESEGVPNYTFNELIYRIRLEVPAFQLYGGYGRNIPYEGDDETLTFTNIGVRLTGGVNVFSRERFNVVLPFEVNPEYTQVNTTLSTDQRNEFRQSSILVGTGISLHWRPLERLRFSTRGLPMVGFAVSSYSGEGGIRYQIENRNRIYIDNLYGQVGLMLGVDFRFDRFNSNQNRFMYDSFGNSVLIGVTF